MGCHDFAASNPAWCFYLFVLSGDNTCKVTWAEPFIRQPEPANLPTSIGRYRKFNNKPAVCNTRLVKRSGNHSCARSAVSGWLIFWLSCCKALPSNWIRPGVWLNVCSLLCWLTRDSRKSQGPWFDPCETVTIACHASVVSGTFAVSDRVENFHNYFSFHQVIDNGIQWFLTTCSEWKNYSGS